MPKLFRDRYGLLVVIVLMTAYSAYFSALSIQRQNTFRTYASDMGQMDQALWNTLHGHLLENTLPNGKQAPRLADHVEPIFLVVPLVFLIHDGIESLFVVQSVIIALGALPIYWIARRRLTRTMPGTAEWAGMLFAAMYLLFPALQATNLAEFHAVTFAPAPLMFAYNFGEERAWKRFALFALIALGVKEDMALLVLAMALFFAFKPTDDGPQSADRYLTLRVSRFTFRVLVLPLVLAAVSLAWFLVDLYVIVPHFSPRGESVYIGRYPQSPATILAGLFVPDKAMYVLKLLASVGFLALFDPMTLLVGSPSLILNLVSGYDAQYSGTYHYSAPVAPYFVLAAIGGAGWLANSLRRRFPGANRAGGTRLLAALMAPAFLIVLIYHGMAGYTPFGGEFFWPELTAHQRLLSRFTSQIPENVPAMTTATLFPHLSHRQVLYRFGQLPVPADTEYILLDVAQAYTTNPLDYRVNYLDALKQGFGIRDALDGYILLQRGQTRTELPDEFFNFLRACPCVQPQRRVVVDFGDKVRLLGFDVRQDDWQRLYLRTYWTRLPAMDNNFALFPFYAGANGLRADAELPPLLVHFWYPTSKWVEGEVIAADTLPIDIGTHAQIGVAVFFGPTWNEAEFTLPPRTEAPISADGKWVSIGELARQGKRYELVK